MEDRLRELGAFVRRERSRQELGSQTDLARRVKIGPRKVSDVERGVRAGAKTYDAIERVLDLPEGSIERYLRSGAPLPAVVRPVDESGRAESPADDEPPYEWSAESRRKLITMSMQEVLLVVEHTRLLRGDAEAERANRAIMRLREEVASIDTRAEAP